MTLFGSLGDLQHDNNRTPEACPLHDILKASVLAGGGYSVARKLFGSLEDLQHDNRIPEACPLLDNLKASVLASGDYSGGEEAFRQPGGPEA